MGGSSWMCLRSTTAPATPADRAGSDLVDVPRSHLPLLPLGGDAPQGRTGLHSVSHWPSSASSSGGPTHHSMAVCCCCGYLASLALPDRGYQPPPAQCA